MYSKERQNNKKGERQNAPWWDETCAELVKYRAEIRKYVFKKHFTPENFDFLVQVEKETKSQLRKIKNEKLKGTEEGKINANADPKAIESTTESLKNITIAAKKLHSAGKDHEVVENAGNITSEDVCPSQHPQTSKSEILENQSASTDTPANSI